MKTEIESKTALLLSTFFAKSDKCSDPVRWESKLSGELKKEFITGMSDILDLQTEKPKSPITFDLSNERLFTDNKDYLIVNPLEELEKSIETACFIDDEYHWSKIKLCRRPKNIIPFGKPHAWAEVHSRIVKLDGKEDYFAECLPINKDGYAMPFKVSGWHMAKGLNKNAKVALIVRCSMLEDYNRAEAIKAEASIDGEDLSIRFSMPQGSQVDFFKLREAPRTAKSGRLNPILHFCSSHLRRNGENQIAVKEHWRGADEIKIDGMKVKITA